MSAPVEVDVVVIGVGTCGEDLSLQLLDGGLDVAGVEASLVGGECAYWACLPSKRMIRMGGLLAEARRADALAGRTAVTPDWGLVAAQVRDEVTGGWDDSTAVDRFGRRGGTLLKGHGRLVAPRTVVVGDETLVARRGVVLATGSQPAIPSIPGLDEVEYWTTHDVIAAPELPESLVVLGGGAVGCELGQLLARFGVSVSIVEAGERLMSRGEPEASAAIEKALTSDGVRLHTGRAVERVFSEDGAIGVVLADRSRVTGDRLLVATGRRVDLSGLGLETVGLDPDARFLETDDRMRVAEGLWAIGDATGKAMFTHVALYQGSIVAADLLGRSHPGARYDALPMVTFTDPEVGAVGVTEAEARKRGLDVVAVVKQVPSTFRGWLHRTGNEGFIKLVVDRDAATLVGATVAGPRAGELLGMLGLAIHARIPIADLRSMIYAFPTFYGGVGETIGASARGVVTVIDPGYEGLEHLDTVG